MDIVESLGEFDKIRFLIVGKPRLSIKGIELVNQLLVSEGIDELPRGFLHYETTRKGKFAARVFGYALAYYGVKLTNSSKAEIGNIAFAHTLRGDGLLFDITHDVMTWPRGSFGHFTSCFRNSRSGSIPMIANGGKWGRGFTIRIFKPGGEWYGKYAGYGRVWVLPYKYDTLVMFNGYGQDIQKFGNMTVDILNEVGYDASSKRVGIGNGIRSELYLNGDGILVGKGSSLKRVDDATFNITPWAHRECHACAKVFEITLADMAKRGMPTSRDSQQYCLDCGATCQLSGDFRYKGEMVYAPYATIKKDRKPFKLGTGSKGWIKKSFDNKVAHCDVCFATYGKQEKHNCEPESGPDSRGT